MSIENDSGRDCGLNRRRMDKPGIPVMLDMGSEGCCLIGTLIPTHKLTMLTLVDKHAS